MSVMNRHIQATRDDDTERAGTRGYSILTAVLEAKLTWRLLTMAVFLAIWQIYATVAGSLLTPTVPGTILAFGELLVSTSFWEAVWLSNQSLLLGYGVALALGIPFGLLMGRGRKVDRIAGPYVDILVVIPMAAIIPLLIMALGLGLLPRVLLVVAFTIPIVIINSRAGVRQVDAALIEMARTFGATEKQIWSRILLPGALPAIMTGIRIGLGRAVTAMVIIELLMVAVGLGGLILAYRGSYQPGPLYAVVAFTVVEALVLIRAVQWFERRVYSATGSDLARRRSQSRK